VIQVSEHAEGCVVAVRAQPGARRNAIVGEQAGCLKVAVAAPATDGRANQALVEVLAEGLGLKRSQVELLRGASQREKRFLLRRVSVEQLRQLLQASLGAAAEKPAAKTEQLPGSR
jgi:uncharacterized protein (TIGR00251 family)